MTLMKVFVLQMEVACSPVEHTHFSEMEYGDAGENTHLKTHEGEITGKYAGDYTL